jgi:hypothetical protein
MSGNGKASGSKSSVVASKPATNSNKKAKRNDNDSPTFKSKIFQSFIAFMIVNSIYHSGEQLNTKSREEKCFIKFQMELPNFIEHRGNLYSHMTEYKTGDFSLEQMRNQTSAVLMTGKKILEKGLAVRRSLTRFIEKARKNDY